MRRMMMNTRHRSSPFTESQWQELEHQALICKYMMSGLPISSDLLYSVRRGLDATAITTLTPPRIFPPQPIGWGCFQMGCGRKADPEPGRCRRTDGKKWRCSKEAFPDSKYCEKHMHRGRNRSRKPVEITTAAAAGTKASDLPFANPPPNPAKSTSTSSLSSSLTAENHHPYLYPHPLSIRPPGTNFSVQNNTPHFIQGTGPYSSTDREYRYLHGPKEGVDELPFFSETSGNLRSASTLAFDGSWRSKTSSLSQLNHRNCSVFPSNQSQMQMHNNQRDISNNQTLEQHCFSLGTDAKLDSPVKLKREEEPKQPLRQFFDEWPLKSRHSWLDLEEDPSNLASFSATQLSISIPMASSEFPAANPRPRNGERVLEMGFGSST